MYQLPKTHPTTCSVCFICLTSVSLAFWTFWAIVTLCFVWEFCWFWDLRGDPLCCFSFPLVSVVWRESWGMGVWRKSWSHTCRWGIGVCCWNKSHCAWYVQPVSSAGSGEGQASNRRYRTIFNECLELIHAVNMTSKLLVEDLPLSSAIWQPSIWPM